ncbi:hypothetical protein YC2023_055445 [Brassica napus]
MRSRSDSEEQFTLDTNYVPPDTTDFETQQVMARLPAIDENDDQRDGGDDGNKQGRKRKLISLVDLEEDSDVEITPTTQTRKPPRKTSFGTASQKPIGSSAHACSQKKTVPLKFVIRGGRRKPAPRSRKNKGPSTQSRKNKGPSTESLKKKSKIQEEIPDFDDELVCSGAACSVETHPSALLLRSARETACKGLWTWAVRDWDGLLETAARAGRARLNPRDDDPAAVRDGTG